MILLKKQTLQRLNSIIKFFISSNGYSTNNFKSTLHLKKYNRKLPKQWGIRNFSINPRLWNFYTTETNQAAHYLQSSDTFCNSIALTLLPIEKLPFDNNDNLIEKQWISMNNSELLENFELLSYYAAKVGDSLDDIKYNGILEVLSSKVLDFSDSDIRHFLNCLTLWNPYKEEKTFKGLWKTVDSECLKRFRNWNIDEILMTTDIFYRLKVIRQSEFCWQSLKRLGFKPQLMNYQQLVHFTFLMKVSRKLPLRVYNVEYYLEQCLDNLTVQDLGIVAMAFSKYETPFRSQHFITTFLDKLLENLDTVNEIYLINIIDNIRIKDKKFEKIEMLLEGLEKRLPKLSLNCLSRIANFQRKILYFRDSLMSKIIKRFEEEIKEAKIKDIERLVFALYIFAFNPKEVSFYHICEKELSSRAEEIEKFPKPLLTIVKDMLQAGYFCNDLLQIILDPIFINKVCKNDRWRLKQEYLVLDFCLEIDHPEYNGPRLDLMLRDYLIKRFGTLRGEKKKQFSDIKSRDEETLIEVANICKKVLASDSLVHIDYALPYTTRNFIFLCYDSEIKKYETPIEKLSAIPADKLKYAPNDGKVWYALVFGNPICIVYNTKERKGDLNLYLRHLQQIGYTPIMIPYYEWNNRDENEKQKYISDLLPR